MNLSKRIFDLKWAQQGIIEKRQLRKDEIEYEKNQMREKLDEEVWEDLTFDEEPKSLEMNNPLLEIDTDNSNV